MKKVKDYCGLELSRLRQGTLQRTHLNPYILEADTLTGCLYTFEELEEQFPAIFPTPGRPILVEIGCYKGGTLMELAEKNPGFNVLGIDIRYKRVVKTCRKILARNLDNCKVGLCTGGNLLAVLPEASLAGVVVFFPDPWQKEKQQKHRLLNREFFQRLAAVLKPGGFTWFKTDDREYYFQSLEFARKSGLQVSAGLPARLAAGTYTSPFEQLFLKQKIPIYQGTLLKSARIVI